MDLSLFFAGTGGSVPSARRGLPALLVRRGGDRLLFDCGEGTQRQLVRSIGLVDLDSVFITHFHADHWLGLPGMLKSFALREREQPLTVYGPRGLSELMGVMRSVYGRLPYELSIVELEPAQTVQRDGYAIAAIPVSHRAPSSFGYALVEDARPGHLDAALAEQLGVAPGPRLRPPAARRDRRRRHARAGHGRRAARGARSCSRATPRRARRWRSPPTRPTCWCTRRRSPRRRPSARARPPTAPRAQAAELARDAEVRLLALTHISSRYAGGELRDEARAVFAATEAPRDFDTIEVPFPERGPADAAALVRAPGARARGSAGAAGERGRRPSRSP